MGDRKQPNTPPTDQVKPAPPPAPPPKRSDAHVTERTTLREIIVRWF